MSCETRARKLADTNPTNDEWAEEKEHWNDFSDEAKAHWEEAKQHWNEFTAHVRTHVHKGKGEWQKNKAEWRKEKGVTCGEWHAGPHLLEVKLPNDRRFSISLGQVIMVGLLIWWLPFNWVLLGGLIWLAYMVGGDKKAGSAKPKRDALDKPKVSDEDAEDFEIYHV